jgi:hypothetical protein
VPQTAAADARARAGRQAELEAEERSWAAGVRLSDAWREPYLALRAAERAENRRCAAQRFFALTRFDLPLALQPPGYGNAVYYAGRDLALARAAGPIGECDYVITTDALQETDKGRALAAALSGGAPLRERARARGLVLLEGPPR